MWCWDVGCAGARLYINHTLASAKLADHFEKGEAIDDSLYVQFCTFKCSLVNICPTNQLVLNSLRFHFMALHSAEQ